MPEIGLDDPTSPNPIATIDVTTVFYVTAISENGCIEVDSVKITAIPKIGVVDGFTPNGDGINDIWEIDFINDYPNIEVEIYNRWGEKLFYSKGYNNPWNGEYKGKILPTGTYYYIIRLNDPEEKMPVITGPVTIVR
jgi:gliding motility-associated-like protein